ncbi:hypothetical protein BDP55DRAFT_681555 [Colletotrichum godetiae]|uniref:Uncharacterized protein n=1 Tax=Colletotrichum godetiae TaxID=1209918 RepID=A0AAJ0A9B5_9PEZI|nr:uncharacterized protein BDP55DRAFT_681555 [Colletotrichum godetiae]KAK1658872.1 hypothetical protein BDP55DRAFT_681555 [Colletotrichum godetiae]
MSAPRRLISYMRRRKTTIKNKKGFASRMPGSFALWWDVFQDLCTLHSSPGPCCSVRYLTG